MKTKIGHNKEAEKLKQEIDEEIKRLTLKKESNENYLENNNNIQESKETKKQEDNLQKLEQIQKERSAQRKKELNRETSGNITYGSGKNW